RGARPEGRGRGGGGPPPPSGDLPRAVCFTGARDRPGGRLARRTVGGELRRDGPRAARGRDAGAVVVVVTRLAGRALSRPRGGRRSALRHQSRSRSPRAWPPPPRPRARTKRAGGSPPPRAAAGTA